MGTAICLRSSLSQGLARPESECVKRQNREAKIFESRYKAYMSKHNLDEGQLTMELKEQLIPGEDPDIRLDARSPIKFPVFYTADIPAGMLDDFLSILQRTAKDPCKGNALPAILMESSLDNRHIFSQPPASALESPFLGKSSTEVFSIAEGLTEPLDSRPSL